MVKHTMNDKVKVCETMTMLQRERMQTNPQQWWRHH